LYSSNSGIRHWSNESLFHLMRSGIYKPRYECSVCSLLLGLVINCRHFKCPKTGIAEVMSLCWSFQCRSNTMPLDSVKLFLLFPHEEPWFPITVLVNSVVFTQEPRNYNINTLLIANLRSFKTSLQFLDYVPLKVYS
jgi:hypothetical protein